MSAYLDAIVATSNLMNADQQVRRYGFEIESPSVGAYANTLEEAGFGLTVDGSVERPDCFCECDDCQAHECDCRNCDSNSGWQDIDHCSGCQANEAQSPILTTHKPSKIAEALDELNDNFTAPSGGDDWGQHVHIEARDLTVAQVYSVAKLGAVASRILPDLFGRDYNSYAQQITAQTIAEFHYGSFEKYNEVNISPVMRYKRDNSEQPARYEIGEEFSRFPSKSTVEFRLFETTADPELIFARVAVCRAIVATAKKSGLYWALNAKTPTEFLNAIEFGKH